MAEIQSKDARKLLRIISSVIAKDNTLTYRQAAELMGRVPPQHHSRAIAQMCDLLDAAACLAGVPLLALVAVREESGEINRKAWKTEYGSRRAAIIERSLGHRFTGTDIEAISNAIGDLGPRGNRAAWKFLFGVYPGDMLYHRIIGDHQTDDLNAIEDLGTDSPGRSKSEVWSYARDPSVRNAVLQRANGRCEFCGEIGFIKHDGTPYLESHHIIALANDGEDRITNVIGLCPNDHREAHFGERAEEIEVEMILKMRIMNSERVP